MSNIGTINDNMPCRKCGYDLIGLDINPNCPECGTLNLHAEPFRGVETFEYCPKRHSNSLFLFLAALGLAALMLLAIKRDTALVDMATIGVLAVASVLVLHWLQRWINNGKGVSIDWDKKVILASNATRWRFPFPHFRRNATIRFTDVVSHGFVASKHRRWLRIQTTSGSILLPEYFESIDLLARRLEHIQPQPVVRAKISIVRVTIVSGAVMAALGALTYLAIRNDFWV